MQDRPVLHQDGWCFACGPDNPHGLHLSGFRREGKECVVSFVPQRQHQGWQGLIHGGIVATLLDEAMTHLLQARGERAVTASLTVRYHCPLAPGEPVEVRARAVGSHGRLVKTQAELRDHEGTLIASARAKFMVLPPPTGRCVSPPGSDALSQR